MPTGAFHKKTVLDIVLDVEPFVERGVPQLDLQLVVGPLAHLDERALFVVHDAWSVLLVVQPERLNKQSLLRDEQDAKTVPLIILPLPVVNSAVL